MKKLFLIPVLLVSLAHAGLAQTGISAVGTAPDASAMLDVIATDKGMLVPRVALVATNNSLLPVPAPADGLLVYNTGLGGVAVKGFYYWDATNSLWQKVQAGNGSFVTGSGTQNYVTKWNNAAGTTIGNSQIFDNGTSVGIGTAAPVTKFHLFGIHGTTQARLTLPAAANGGGTGDVSIQMWASEPGISWDAGGIGMNLTNDGGTPNGFGRLNAGLGQSYIRFIPNGGAMAFNTTNNAGTYYQTMYMTGGNIGIGNTAPAHQLSVGAATADGQAVTIRGYSNSPASWKGGGAFGYTSAAVIMGELSGVAHIGGHNATLTAWADLAINSGGGNVGIGTSTPQAKLHVEAGKIYGSKTSFPNPASYTNADLVLGSNTDTRGGYTGTNGSHIFLRSSDKSSITALDESNNLGQIAYQNLVWIFGEDIGWGTQVLRAPNLAGAGTRFVVADASGNLSAASSTSSGVVTGAGTLNYVPKWTPDGARLGNSLMYDNGTAVGIGTTAPVGKFHIAGSHANGVMADGNDRPSFAATGNYPQLVLMGGVANGSHGATIMLGGYDSGNSGNHKHWSIGTAGNGATFLDIGYHAGTDLNPHAGIRNYVGSTFMTIINTGNVGIGTTAPAQKLEVNGNIFNRGILYQLTSAGQASAAHGISWYDPSFVTWYDYMAPAGATNSPNGSAAPSDGGSGVTSWARRFNVENVGGYGWIFESGPNSGTAPTVKFSINSNDGKFHTVGGGYIEGNLGVGATPMGGGQTRVNISRDGALPCCGGEDATLGLAESTSGTGRRPSISFHAGGEAEGQIELTQTATGLGPTARRFRMFDHQGSQAGLQLTGNLFFGNSDSRSQTRNDAGLMGNAGAQSGFYENDGGTVTNYYSGASGWQHMIDVRHNNPANNYAMQLAGSFFDQRLFIRKTNNNASTAWSELSTIGRGNGGMISYVKNDYYGVSGTRNTWVTVTGASPFMDVRAGDQIKLDGMYYGRLTGGSGNEYWYSRIQITGQNGCGTNYSNQHDYWHVDEGGGDHDNYKPVVYMDVWNCNCTGQIRFEYQIYMSGDDNWEAREIIITGTRY